jgi:hypothetical protein
MDIILSNGNNNLDISFNSTTKIILKPRSPITIPNHRTTLIIKDTGNYDYTNTLTTRKIHIILDDKECLERNYKAEQDYIKSCTLYGCNKRYILPSGKIIIVQGYEHFALDILFKTYDESQIIVNRNKVPRVFWKDSNDIRHRYFADIYIPIERKIIEVKSSWTYNLPISFSPLNHEKIKLVPLKCLKLGYKYEYWIFDSNGNRTIISDFTKPYIEPVKQPSNKPKRRVLYLDNLDD